jgi:hypothetical protein
MFLPNICTVSHIFKGSLKYIIIIIIIIIIRRNRIQKPATGSLCLTALHTYAYNSSLCMQYDPQPISHFNSHPFDMLHPATHFCSKELKIVRLGPRLNPTSDLIHSLKRFTSELQHASNVHQKLSPTVAFINTR